MRETNVDKFLEIWNIPHKNFIQFINSHPWHLKTLRIVE